MLLVCWTELTVQHKCFFFLDLVAKPHVEDESKSNPPQKKSVERRRVLVWIGLDCWGCVEFE